MLNKEDQIQAIMQRLGWAYSDLRWITAEQAAKATQERDKLIDEIAPGRCMSFWGNKLHKGPLSPGCVTCGEGTWACMFINVLCTRHCFFCPQDRDVNEERLPRQAGIIFRDPEEYAEFIERLGYKGVGFSGGEPFLVFDRLLAFVRALRKICGASLYLWVYSSGDHVDRSKLMRLREAGLDEIRFNLAAVNYDVGVVEPASGLIDTVSVEIPAIPEDYERVSGILSSMEKIGVDHLNLHQLYASRTNYRALSRRGYTFLHNSSYIPVLESEMTALRLIADALLRGISLPINYCSQPYKVRLQGRGSRLRAATLARRCSEGVTESGYVRRITIRGPAPELTRLVESFEASGLQKILWELNGDKDELAIDLSIVGHVNGRHTDFALEYYDLFVTDGRPRLLGQCPESTDSYFAVATPDREAPESGHEDHEEEFALSSKRALSTIRRRVVAFQDLSLVTMQSLRRLLIDRIEQKEVLRWFAENYEITTNEDIDRMAREKAILRELPDWEMVPVGFSEIY